MGPILFVLYINDLPEAVQSDIYLFADDTKILRQITSRDEACKLKEDVDSLELWSHKWLLSFNPYKCHVLSLGRFENIKHMHRYNIYEEELDHVFEKKRPRHYYRL